MSRQKKSEQEAVPEIKAELISLDRALLIFLVEKPHKAVGLRDKEALKLSMIRKVPSLMATMEEWKHLLNKF